MKLKDFTSTSTSTSTNIVVPLEDVTLENDENSNQLEIVDDSNDATTTTTTTTTNEATPTKKILCLSVVVWAHLSQIVAQMCYLFYYVFAKAAMREGVTAFIFTFIRLCFAIASMTPLFLIKSRFVPQSRKQVLIIIGVGFFLCSLNQLSGVLGIAATGPIIMGLMQVCIDFQLFFSNLVNISFKACNTYNNVCNVDCAEE